LSRSAVWLAAGRRFLGLLAGASAVVLLVSVALGLLLGSSLNRAVSLGFYLAGASLVFGGFFFGNRGPVRVTSEERGVRLGRELRSATPEEMHEAINMSAVLVVLGFVLLALGAAVDTRYQLI
jgi:hypothetical protein